MTNTSHISNASIITANNSFNNTIVNTSTNRDNSNTGNHVLDDYRVLGKVGNGAFANVYKVHKISTNQILVWKELCYGKMNGKARQMLCDEVNILRGLNHPNIVRFYDRIIDHSQHKIFILQEFCANGDLESYIKKKKQKKNSHINENFIWSVVSEISSALQHCQDHHNRFKKKSNGSGSTPSSSTTENKVKQNISSTAIDHKKILHRDLKPGNIFLVRQRNTYSVKLGDFGLAKILDESSAFAKTQVGTPYYMSPEKIESNLYNEKSDIWSLGCIAYEMAMLSPPFNAKNYLELAKKIKAGVFKCIRVRNYSQKLSDAITSMLKINFRERASANEILKLPQVQMSLKLLKIDRRYVILKDRETAVTGKAQAIKIRESKLKAREQSLRQREMHLVQCEQKLTTEKNALHQLIDDVKNGSRRRKYKKEHPQPPLLLFKHKYHIQRQQSSTSNSSNSSSVAGSSIRGGKRKKMSRHSSSVSASICSSYSTGNLSTNSSADIHSAVCNNSTISSNTNTYGTQYRNSSSPSESTLVSATNIKTAINNTSETSTVTALNSNSSSMDNYNNNRRLMEWQQLSVQPIQDIQHQSFYYHSSVCSENRVDVSNVGSVISNDLSSVMSTNFQLQQQRPHTASTMSSLMSGF